MHLVIERKEMSNNINNPYAVAFGRIPTSYIKRDIVIDEVLSAFLSENVDSQCYKLTGVRGSGKTVTMTSIIRMLNEQGNWICIDLSASDNILHDLLAIIYDKVPYMAQFIDAELNLSEHGIGITVSKNRPVASVDVAVGKVLNELKKKNKKLLVTIDEIVKNEETVHFIKFFQQMVREELPIYFIAAGLQGKIEELENTGGLTFFLRSDKLKMKPLNFLLIRSDYQNKLSVTKEVAEELAYITKGYAFAYQALGKYMWEEKENYVSENVLNKMDAALADGAYRIIWRELSESEKMYVSFLCKKDEMDVSELLELTKKKASDWTRPRKNLIDKDLIEPTGRGTVKFVLPRFDVFLSYEINS